MTAYMGEATYTEPYCQCDGTCLCGRPRRPEYVYYYVTGDTGLCCASSTTVNVLPRYKKPLHEFLSVPRVVKAKVEVRPVSALVRWLQLSQRHR